MNPARHWYWSSYRDCGENERLKAAEKVIALVNEDIDYTEPCAIAAREYTEKYLTNTEAK